ncbi:MAG: ATP-binding cassette domain-containing protein [Alphaproteobacteria bacterium]
MNHADPILSLSNVSKSYGKIHALRDVSFDIKAGEFVGLLGPNGAGKSTIFQIISGLFAPDGGAVTIFGRQYRDNPSAILSRLGVVFQDRSADLDLTIKANLAFHGRLFGLSGKRLQDRIQEQTTRFGMQDMSDRRVRQLSGGQQRKVEIARALMNRPTLLIMDEATAGLDAPSRSALVQDIFSMAKGEGVSILWATHLVDEVAQADRVILLKSGQVLADSTPHGLLEEAATTDLTEAYAKLVGSTAKTANS